MLIKIKLHGLIVKMFRYHIYIYVYQIIFVVTTSVCLSKTKDFAMTTWPMFDNTWFSIPVFSLLKVIPESYLIVLLPYYIWLIPLECTCSIASWHGSVLTTFSIIFRNVSIICEHNNVYGSLLTHNQLF